MTCRPLLAHEIGSLAKPSWKVASSKGILLNDADYRDMLAWGERLKIEHIEDTIEGISQLQPEQLKIPLLELSSLLATRLLERAGLDTVWDGEQHRIEMYEYPVRRMTGFVFRGHVRSFDNKYYDKASCVAPPSFTTPFHVEEYKRIATLANKPVKIPITGAYTLVDWSFDEHYSSSVAPGQANLCQGKRKARSLFIEAVAGQVIHPNLQALFDVGARYLQIDEPAAATKAKETLEFVQSLATSIGTLAGKAFFSTHICFSDYHRLFPAMNDLEGILNEIHFEYANRDSKALGTTAKIRTGYEPLGLLKDTSFIVGLGVIDVHTDFIESPELVRDRILYATKLIKDPHRIFVAPDCGLRTRTWDVAYQKLHNMVLGRDMALKELGL